jgi:hypothetical protein
MGGLGVVPGPDFDSQMLQQANQAVVDIDLRFKAASFNDKLALADSRDRAFHAFALARLKLLQAGVICTAADVNQMAQIRAEISQAASTQSLITAIGRIVGFLIKFA